MGPSLCHIFTDPDQKTAAADILSLNQNMKQKRKALKIVISAKKLLIGRYGIIKFNRV